MLSFAGRSRLVVIALTSVLVGLMLGSGIAYGHEKWVPKDPGRHDYVVRHESDTAPIYDFTETRDAYTSGDYKEFKLYKTRYSAGTAPDTYRYGVLLIWEEHNGKSESYTNFYCAQVNSNTGYRANTTWTYKKHRAPNYGTAIEQYMMTSGPGCGYPDGEGIHAMTLYKEQ